jgi:flagellar biosynthesis/type III secretory pathway M-ring protein FliF/YscJ
MLQDLAALTPPAIVCAAVLIGAWAIVRRELAPKRKERAQEAAAAEEERAVDSERGRSLYSRHRRFIGALALRYARLRSP